MVTITESFGEQSRPFPLINHYSKGANFIFFKPSVHKAKQKVLSQYKSMTVASWEAAMCDSVSSSDLASPSSDSQSSLLFHKRPCWHQASLMNSTQCVLVTVSAQSSAFRQGEPVGFSWKNSQEADSQETNRTRIVVAIVFSFLPSFFFKAQNLASGECWGN